jgi:hypothetical protein
VALGNDAENRTFAEKLRPDRLNCSKPESRDACCSAVCRRAIKKIMNMRSSNASLGSYAGPGNITSAVQLQELRNRDGPARSCTIPERASRGWKF